MPKKKTNRNEQEKSDAVGWRGNMSKGQETEQIVVSGQGTCRRFANVQEQNTRSGVLMKYQQS